MNTTDYLTIINLVLEILGNVTLHEAKTWLETEENAAALLKEAQEKTDAGK